jgi:hypothetical protein
MTSYQFLNANFYELYIKWKKITVYTKKLTKMIFDIPFMIDISGTNYLALSFSLLIARYCGYAHFNPYQKCKLTIKMFFIVHLSFFTLIYSR